MLCSTIQELSEPVRICTFVVIDERNVLVVERRCDQSITRFFQICLIDVFDPRGVFHYESGNVSALVDALSRVVTELDSLSSRGQANLEKARPWTWQAAARQTRAVYEQITR